MIKVGDTYPSRNYGNVEILDTNNSGRYCTVRFVKTGTIKRFREDHVRSGCLRDPFAPSLCGVACTGEAKTKGKNQALYDVWHDMINRCYNPHNKSYDAYKSVTVSNSWLVFANFLEDAPLIEGFDYDKIINGDLVLDKDTKQRWSPNKIYSMETCIWIPPHENNLVQDGQQKPFVGISPDGRRFEDYNITQFAREHGLERRHISGVLHGRCKTTAGWHFYYL